MGVTLNPGMPLRDTCCVATVLLNIPSKAGLAPGNGHSLSVPVSDPVTKVFVMAAEQMVDSFGEGYNAAGLSSTLPLLKATLKTTELPLAVVLTRNWPVVETDNEDIRLSAALTVATWDKSPPMKPPAEVFHTLIFPFQSPEKITSLVSPLPMQMAETTESCAFGLNAC